ncbi:MAG TPA: hypothetical protein VJ873_13825 [bacterium]|nr:hypothetical protein [bacterium]
MKWSMMIYRLGAFGVLLTLGVFGEEPLASSLRQDPSAWLGTAILYGFAGLGGVLLLSVRDTSLRKSSRTLMYVSHGAALIAVLWLILWCFVWLAMMSNMGDKAEMFIKHTAYLHLFGVSFAMAGYVTGWMARGLGERSVRFLMTLSWAVSYMAWFNLFLQPALKWLWAPAIGGLLAVLGAFLVSRQLKANVEAAS